LELESQVAVKVVSAFGMTTVTGMMADAIGMMPAEPTPPPGDTVTVAVPATPP